MISVVEASRMYVHEREQMGTLCALSAKNVRSHLRQFSAWCDENIDGEEPLDLSDLTAAHIEGWLSSSKVSKRTVANRLGTLRELSKWGRRRGYMSSDPTDGIAAPKRPRSVPRAFEADTVAALLEACPTTRERLIVTFMVQEGLRCCEIANLTQADLDRRAGEMVVTGKGGHQRPLPITAPTMRALLAYEAEWPPPRFGPVVRRFDDPVRGVRATWLSTLMRRVMTEAGIKTLPYDGVSAHALRHTAASDVLDRCGDLRVVQEMLGHTSLTTTQIYLRRVGAAKLREAMGGRSY